RTPPRWPGWGWSRPGSTARPRAAGRDRWGRPGPRRPVRRGSPSGGARSRRPRRSSDRSARACRGSRSCRRRTPWPACTAGRRRGAMPRVTCFRTSSSGRVASRRMRGHSVAPIPPGGGFAGTVRIMSADDTEVEPVSPTPRSIGRAGSYSKGIARRQEILDRAIEVFRERGADGTSLRRIAESIGVSHGALLHYFSSREELLVAVYEHAEYRRDRAEEPADVRSVDVMANAALSNLEVPGLVQLYSTLVATALEVEAGPAKEYFTARFDRVRGNLERKLREDQEAGLVRSDVDPARMAALIVAASDGLQIQWLLEPSIALKETLETFAVLLAP